MEVFTSRQDYTLGLGRGISLRAKCDYAGWLWGAYELINADVEYCGDDLIMKYLSTYRRLRWERSVKLIVNLKSELVRVRNELRRNCTDELTCLANRLYEYGRAVNMLYGYYRRIHELGPEDLSKLSVALNRYNMPLMSLRAFDELMSLPGNDELKYLTFISLLNPVVWPFHVTMDVRVMPYLNWVLMYINGHFIILIMSLGRAYVISDLNININGGRVVLGNDYEFRSVTPTHIITRIESRDGHGLLFIGNWSDEPIDFNPDFRPREGSVKGLSLDVNLSQLIPMIVPPHDYLSIKYSV